MALGWRAPSPAARAPHRTQDTLYKVSIYLQIQRLGFKCTRKTEVTAQRVDIRQ